MKKFLFLFLILLVINGCGGNLSFQERREEVLLELNSAVKEAKEEGKYKCCIEPACTMCYLGNWLWKDGSCYCDDMILEGEADKVCPQCIRAMEEGLCGSSQEDMEDLCEI
ncbi:MAG: hypothetical protein ABIB47_00045 [Candidatus Woesearchaeota archaeon]